MADFCGRACPPSAGVILCGSAYCNSTYGPERVSVVPRKGALQAKGAARLPLVILGSATCTAHQRHPLSYAKHEKAPLARDRSPTGRYGTHPKAGPRQPQLPVQAWTGVLAEVRARAPAPTTESARSAARR